jgi:hypothetical protein
VSVSAAGAEHLRNHRQPSQRVVAQDNVELVREGFARWQAGDYDLLLDFLLANAAPDIEVYSRFGGLSGTPYQGHDGLRAWLAEIQDTFERFEPCTFMSPSPASVLKASAIRVSSGRSAERSKKRSMPGDPGVKTNRSGHDQLRRSATCGGRPLVERMSGGRRVVGLIQPEAKAPFEHVHELVLVDVQVQGRALSRCGGALPGGQGFTGLPAAGLVGQPSAGRVRDRLTVAWAHDDRARAFLSHARRRHYARRYGRTRLWCAEGTSGGHWVLRFLPGGLVVRIPASLRSRCLATVAQYACGGIQPAAPGTRSGAAPVLPLWKRRDAGALGFVERERSASGLRLVVEEQQN